VTTEPSAIVIPFGKHKGATVAELLAKDPQYVDWIMAQGWVAQRFAELHAALATRGAGNDDTPEHNAIQVRFLDPIFCRAFWLAAEGNADWYRLEGFEIKGADVSFTASAECNVKYSVRYKEDSITDHIRIEIKPAVGDDFPSVMRQMRTLHCKLLVVGEFTGRGVSEQQMCQMFEANGMKVVFIRDIEAEIAQARAWVK
jgi:uncharacterized protein (DUF3820 family)